MLSRRCFNPAIFPGDDDWKEVHRSFTNLVRKSDKTLGDILLQYFTKYEARMFVAQDRSSLKEIQARNTERYKTLLAKRFNSVESDLITKLTMMYFGLPIEPVEAALDEATESDLQLGEEQRSKEQPLQFLSKKLGKWDKGKEFSRSCKPLPVREPVEFDEPGIYVVDDQPQSASCFANTGSNRNLPMVGKFVMTVKEQAELLRAFRTVQSIALNRYYPCPFEGCKYQCRPGEEKLTRAHFERAHMDKKCPFCDEQQYWWWSPTQQARHLRERHRSVLMDAMGVRRADLIHDDGSGKFVIPLKKVAPREITSPPAPTSLSQTEGSWLPPVRRPVQLQQHFETFCEFCGRSRYSFASDYEENYHDRLCRVSSFKGARCTFCACCGEPRFNSREDAIKSGLSVGGLVACSHMENAGGPFCKDCGLDYIMLPSHTDSQHRLVCRGYSAVNGVFCAYCGKKLVKDDNEDVMAPHAVKHRMECFKKVAALRQREAEGSEPSDLFESPPWSSYSSSSEAEDAEDVRGRSRTSANKGKHIAPVRQKNSAALPKPAKKKGKCAAKRQRSPSPDWNQVLGTPDAEFLPDNNYYCSKCLRKVPKSTRRGRAQALFTIEEEIKSHTAPDRCCRIRNGIGSAEDLPNRSGWIPASKISAIGKLKDKFLRVHPSYRRTIYPLESRDYNSNMWRSDPNNTANSAWWDIPWPPYTGQLPLPDGWEAPEEDDNDEEELYRGPSEERAPRSKSKGKAKAKDKGKSKKRPQSESYIPSREEPLTSDSDEAESGGNSAAVAQKKRRRSG